jgi:hypothetical protein
VAAVPLPEHLGAGPEAERRLRADYAERTPL